MHFQTALAAPAQAYDTEAPDDPHLLIDYILRRYHEVHRREFAAAIRLAQEVEAAQGPHLAGPDTLSAHLAAMSGELDRHQRREEELLFPAMLEGAAACLPFALTRMRDDHDGVRRHLDELTAQLRICVAPVSALDAWRELIALCEKLSDDLREHMRLEDQVLFPQFL